MYVNGQYMTLGPCGAIRVREKDSKRERERVTDRERDKHNIEKNVEIN